MPKCYAKRDAEIARDTVVILRTWVAISDEHVFFFPHFCVLRDAKIATKIRLFRFFGDSGSTDSNMS